MLKSAANHAAHVVMEGLIGIAGVITIAGCILAWRLGQGPIDITSLAQREQAGLTGAGARLTIGHAVIAWEGFHDPTSPVDIRVTGIKVAAANGTSLLNLPSGRVALSLGQLLLGRVVPQTIIIDDPTVNLRRTADGKLLLDLNNKADEPETSRQGGNQVMAELARPARGGDDRQKALPFLSQLRRVLVRHAHVTLHDSALGVVWQAQDGSADLTRLPGGGVAGNASLALVVGDLHATLTTHAELTDAGTRLTASTTDINPAAVAKAIPAFAGLAALDAPLRVALEATVAPDMAPRTLHLTGVLGAGAIHAGKGEVAIQSGEAALDLTPTQAVLHSLKITMATLPGETLVPPSVTINATGARGQSGMSASFTIDIGALSVSDLAKYWPEGVGGGSRPWLLENLTSGTVSNGHLAGSIDAAPDFSKVALKTLTGGLTGTDVTLWWLRPIPPLQHADAKLTIDNPDEIRIQMSSGAQKDLRLTSGTMRITGLTAKDQFGQIEIGMEGSLPDALSLLAHPRLNLLSRLPFPVDKPAGDVNAHMSVRLPLTVFVTMDQIGISAEAELAAVHLGHVAAGRDLDDGRLILNVDTKGLTVAGDATLGGVPSSLNMSMDFRDGPPGQVVQHATAQGVGTPAQLTQAGMPGSVVTGGTAAVGLDYTAYRNATSTLSLNADLTKAALATPFDWTKPPGTSASIAATLQMAHGRITGIDTLRAQGPGLTVASSVSTKDGKQVLHLDRMQLGRSDLHGTIMFPGADNDPWRVNLAGPLLDLSGYLQTKSDDTSDGQDDETKGPAWDVDLNLARVILAKDESVRAVSLSAASNGQHISYAKLSADANGIAASISPIPGGRHLSVNAADAGAVLLAANLFDNIRGGHLTIDANYDDTAPHNPLSGTATLEKFRLLDAPAVGRLLKAMTFYGAVDLLRGPGMGFAKAIAPFTWRQRVLTLKNARAFSASLGITVQGDIDLRHHDANLTGTIVPAYFFNQLLGNIPVLGQLFSPEKGSGVFAARYAVTGKLADPKIAVNALSALTPGVLRNVFGLL
jgi:hypothetical protein